MCIRDSTFPVMNLKYTKPNQGSMFLIKQSHLKKLNILLCLHLTFSSFVYKKGNSITTTPDKSKIFKILPAKAEERIRQQLGKVGDLELSDYLFAIQLSTQKQQPKLVAS